MFSRLVVPSSWGLHSPRKVTESKGIFILHIFGDYLPVDITKHNKRLKSSTLPLWGLKDLSLPLFFPNCYKNISYRDTNFDTRGGLRPPSRFWGVPYLRFWGRWHGWLRGRDVVTGRIISFVLPSNQRRKTDHETQYPDTWSTCTTFVKDQTKIIQIYEHCTSSRSSELREQRFVRSHINIQSYKYTKCPQNSTWDSRQRGSSTNWDRQTQLAVAYIQPFEVLSLPYCNSVLTF